MTIGQKWVSVFALFFLLSSCQPPPPCRQWFLDESFATCSLYNSGRLLLAPDVNNCSLISVEIIRSSAGTQMYLNAYSLAFSTADQDESKSIVKVFVNGEEHTFQAERLVGGQRLLLPDAATEIIISALMNSATVHISAGRYETDVVPNRFPALFQELNCLPIR